MEKLKMLLGRYSNPTYLKLAGLLVVLAIVLVTPGTPDAGGWT